MRSHTVNELLTSAGYLAIGLAIILLAIAGGADGRGPRLLAPSSHKPTDLDRQVTTRGPDDHESADAQQSMEASRPRRQSTKLLTIAGCALTAGRRRLLPGAALDDPIDLRPLW